MKDNCVRRLPLACPAPSGTWSATRYVAPVCLGRRPGAGGFVRGLGHRPVAVFDAGPPTLRTQRRNGRPTSMLNSTCRASVACHPGSSRAFGFRGSAPEIFHSENKITMLLGSEVRRIYLDGRQPPEYFGLLPDGLFVRPLGRQAHLLSRPRS